MHNEEKTKPNNQPTTNIHSKNKKEKKKILGRKNRPERSQRKSTLNPTRLWNFEEVQKPRMQDNDARQCNTDCRFLLIIFWKKNSIADRNTECSSLLFYA